MENGARARVQPSQIGLFFLQFHTIPGAKWTDCYQAGTVSGIIPVGEAITLLTDVLLSQNNKTITYSFAL